jgi:lipopolysaccharide export system protein LptA
MDKIAFHLHIFFRTAIRICLLISILIAVSVKLSGQEPSLKNPTKKYIEVKNADIAFDEFEKSSGNRVTRLLGNVRLKHIEAFMSCDSAHFYPTLNQVIAFSRIHIEQGDTLNLFGDHLYYEGKSQIALVNGNVELIDKETHLYTNSIKYDIANKIAQYKEKGRITNAENTLTSVIGVYFVSKSLFHFKDSVKIVNPDYIMTADTMDYNTKTETAYFTGPSEVKGDSIYIYCEKGWYDTKYKSTRIWENAIIDNKQQIIHGDSLFYDSSTGYGQSFGNVSIADTNKQIMVTGNYAWYYKEPEKFMVTDSAVFIQFSGGDSLFLHADTISSITVADTSVKGYRLMRAYYGCRIFSKNLQSKCDSLSYSFQDSVIRFYDAPILWSEKNQLTSDSMAIFTKNRQTDRMELYNSAFVTSQVDTVRFNQIKGRTLIGYFDNNKLYKININGNGESIYYLLDGENIAGVNKGKCARMEIYIKDGAITNIIQHEAPEGVIDPPDKVSTARLRLEGFNWYDSLRPKKVKDIFNTKPGN